MNKPRELSPGGTHFIRIDPQRCEFLVPRWAFTDPAVLDKERAEIFGRCWLYAGHASEILVRIYLPGDDHLAAG